MIQQNNHRFLKAIMRQPVDATPVWIMRQAGRYLPEYRKTREKAGSFMTLCKTPELACEVTLQPLRRYDLDASIIFSDILTIPDAMGLGLHFVEGQGPVFDRLIQDEKSIDQLSVPDLSKLQYVYDAIKLVRHELNNKVPLIGFCGSPWTLSAYMVDGNSKAGFPRLLEMLEKQPHLLHRLLDILAKSVAAHLQAQAKAGAQTLMLFDTWGGVLNSKNYLEFSLAYIQKIIAQLQTNSNYNNKIPIILFTKGGGKWLEPMAATGCNAIGLDWETSIQDARRQVGAKVALQGNLDPACLLTSPENIRKEVKRVLAEYGKGSGHIFNLGHGITPDVPPENVSVLVEAVHEYSKEYHQ